MIASSRPALVLQHDVAAGPGLIADWIDGHGGTAEYSFVPEADRLPQPDRYGLIVVLGSEHCAVGDHEWIPRESELLAGAHRAGVPVLGICFGAQLLARVLGGEVRASTTRALGWERIESTNGCVSEGPWFQWHFDTFTLPPGGRLLAKGPAGVEAFAVGSSVGVQFHPEVTHEIACTWATVYSSELEQAGVDPASLHEGAPAPEVLAARAFQLFDGLAALS